MNPKIEATKQRILELEGEIERLQQQPVMFAGFSDVRESALVKNLRSLRGQRDKLRRLEAAHG